MEHDPIAWFRYQCIQPLSEAQRGELHLELKKLVGTSPMAPNGRTYRLSRATLMRWLALYRQHGIDALRAKARRDRGTSRKIDGETAQSLLLLKKQKPGLTVTALIYQARCLRIIAPGQHLPKVSVYRLLKRHGLMDAPEKAAIDRRRFEAEAPLELVQSDVMHGPRIKGRKAYLIALIDDHSRLILWAEFRWQETVDEFIAVLVQALRRRGLPRKIYVDNGSAFRSVKLGYSLAQMGVSLIHSTPYRPEGKGKCERWFKTVRENFMPQLSPSDLESLSALNAVLHRWLDGYYHVTPHSTTGEPPLERFVRNLVASRPAPRELEAMFRNRALRKVGKDRVVSLNGKAFEAPVGSIGKSLELRFDANRPDEIEAFDGPRSLGFIKPALVHSNAKVRRSRRGGFDIEPSGQKNAPVSGGVPFGVVMSGKDQQK